MSQILDGMFTGLIFFTVAMTAVSIGLVTSVTALRHALQRRNFLLLVLANVIVVPLIGFAVVSALPLEPGLETGVLLCAICAAGPLGLKTSQLAGSDLAWTLSLSVVLLLLNVVSLPLWTGLLLDRSLTLRAGDMVGVLVVAILLPVVAGLWLRGRFQGKAGGWSQTLTSISNVTLVLAVVVGLAANAGDLAASLSSWLLLPAVAIVLLAGLIGWASPDDRSRRSASTLITLNRATSVALLVVGRVFVDNPEVFTAAVLFGLVQTVTAIGLGFYWGLTGSRSTTVPGWSLRR